MKKNPSPHRRTVLRAAAALPLVGQGIGAAAQTQGAPAEPPVSVTPNAASVDAVPAPVAAPGPHPAPGQPGWPSQAEWDGLRRQVGDALLQPRSPLAACAAAAADIDCNRLFKDLKNPYFLGDDPALTQTLGWVDAWTTATSPYAVAARNAADVVAAVDFARRHRLRLAVRGGGHSFQGTSNAADSLLVWTRRMQQITVHDAFVPTGCDAQAQPTRAVSVGAGALWAHAYDAVTTQGGGYVQGGGCMTVGVAGLVQSGGFGSFSKGFGLASASLLEAEVVTADGQIRIANACNHPDLFWALKGGGGGTFGVVTRLTLRVHPLPETFGAVNFTVRASSVAAYRRLIEMTLDFMAQNLITPQWGEQIRFRRDNSVQVAMVFQRMTRKQAEGLWQPYLDAVANARPDLKLDFAPFKFVSITGQDFWAPTLMKRALGFIARDDRPGAPPTNLFWPGDQGQAGQVLQGYQSTWLPQGLLTEGRRQSLVDALLAATRHWSVSLHLNKGLAGAPADVIEAARDTAVNPAVLDAFALAISGAEQQPAYPGIAGREPDVVLARNRAAAIARAGRELRSVVPDPGSYLSESDYFEADWQRAFWGDNHARLLEVKRRYDPEGLFRVHHGVGS
jgi:hypothetical protein